MRHRVHITATLTLAFAACLFGLTGAQAKKPDNPGGGGGDGGATPAGAIYFLYDTDVLRMNADGSGKTPLGLGFPGLPFEPSHALHGGGHWFLHSIAGGLIATKEDGSMVALLAPGEDGDWVVRQHYEKFRWVYDGTQQDGTDGMVSWGARRVVDGQTVEVAVCRAPVVFDPDTGDVAGLDLDAIEHFRDIPGDYDWSPDGTGIVFSDDGALWIFDALMLQAMPLPVDRAADPAWSPDGSRIAYRVRDGLIDQIETIDFAEFARTTLIKVRRRNALEGEYLYRPMWSPNGTYLVYVKGNTKGYDEEYHAWRCRSDGKQHTNLTGELTETWSGLWTLGWRSE